MAASPLPLATESGSMQQQQQAMLGRQLVVLILKDGSVAVARVAASVMRTCLQLVQRAISVAWTNRGAVLRLLLNIPGLVKRLAMSFLRTRTGRVLITGLASLICIRLSYGSSATAPATPGAAGVAAPGTAAAQAFTGASISLLCGALR